MNDNPQGQSKQELEKIEDDLAASFEQYRLAEGAYMTGTPAGSIMAANHFIKRIAAHYEKLISAARTEGATESLESLLEYTRPYITARMRNAGNTPSEEQNYADGWNKFYKITEDHLKALKEGNKERAGDE